MTAHVESYWPHELLDESFRRTARSGQCSSTYVLHRGFELGSQQKLTPGCMHQKTPPISTCKEATGRSIYIMPRIRRKRRLLHSNAKINASGNNSIYFKLVFRKKGAIPKVRKRQPVADTSTIEVIDFEPHKLQVQPQPSSISFNFFISNN